MTNLTKQKAYQALSRALDTWGITRDNCRGMLVALSGGADSVLLLHCLKHLSHSLHFVVQAVHVNHMIRESATRDEEFCRDLCAKESIKLHVFRENVLSLAARQKRGVEEVARDVRYGLFEELLRTNPTLQYVATAHHAADQAETVLQNLVRGSGLRGLCGIPPQRGQIIRPLLGVPKADILAAVQSLGLAYVEDETNADLSYRRNYLRHEVLPRLQQLNPRLESGLSVMCRHLSEDLAYIESQAAAYVQAHALTTFMARAELAALPPALALRVLGHLYRSGGGTRMPEEVHLSTLLRLNGQERAPFRLAFPGGIEAYGDQTRLCFRPQQPREKKRYATQPVCMGENRLADRDAVLVLTEEKTPYFHEKSANIYKLAKYADLSSATIEGPLYVRQRKDGDAYRYGGITRKVKTLFSDRKLSRDERDRLPLLCDDRGILWIPGFGVREDPQNGEKRALHVYYGWGGGDNE
ncbi:MAG: tRNA lysidine(34) synthetase TilS [Eubacteriales bacterium]